MRKSLTIIVFVSFIAVSKIHAQGCVAIRSTGGFCSAGQSKPDSASQWQLNINNRYFRSFRHFVGTDEQKQRIQQGTEVINHSYTMDLALYRIINSKWSVMIDVPIEAYSRSSLYEHTDPVSKKSVGRFSTHSFGVGDIRFAAYRWIIDPLSSPRGNVQVGLGIKLPTGSYNYQDYFHISDTSTRLGAVDQSIQLGDGGTGLTFELNAFYNLSKKVNVYGNFYYLSNPREQNGISTARGGTPSSGSVANGSAVMSVPDQYMARVGANFAVHHFVFSAGLRDECLPVHDLIGGSNGFRRPGYIISAEPGITYTFKKASLYVFGPVALVRNRTQSVPDKITTRLTGKEAHGDAAFADYVLNVGCTIRL